MLGYLNRPEATAETLRDGWLRTGDAATRHADGTISLGGRLTDMFKSGGYNVSCREVEVALEQHPLVQLAAVVPVPDAVFGEVGHAFLLTRADPAPDAEAVKAFLREHLANYKIPKRYTVVDEMPRLAIGKVDKRKLKDLALA